MKLLLVDNDSDTLLELRALCDAAGYDVTTAHCTELFGVNPGDFALIVLSGGYWYDDELQHLATYRQELALIRKTRTPVLGICLGMQLMHVAFRGVVPLLDAAQSGRQTICLTDEGAAVLGLPEKLTVHKNHTRAVLTAEPDFNVLATSPGHLEAIKHHTRPLLGVQFHPELETPEAGLALFEKLVAAAGS